ncbi:hypothetical protein [Marinobacter bohaiensis]|uniref:hypothetical protein n=1 Tax=Marinobacter bohaiensis TaxID=2201898 RepID=UPI000DAD472D|nr:hypothetical protein [Marinobacter bohaiensis]
MKDRVRALFSPLLNAMDNGQQPHNYRPSHRKILLVMGLLFFILSAGSVFFAVLAGSPAALIPILFFFGVSLVCAVVGWVGSDAAVARIWGNK